MGVDPLTTTTAAEAVWLNFRFRRPTSGEKGEQLYSSTQPLSTAEHRLFQIPRGGMVERLTMPAKSTVSQQTVIEGRNKRTLPGHGRCAKKVK